MDYWGEYVASLETLTEAYEVAESWGYMNEAANCLCLIMERHSVFALIRWLSSQEEVCP